jgi:hypothetical protein
VRANRLREAGQLGDIRGRRLKVNPVKAGDTKLPV